jgi:Domain of unknown function (DUF4384)/FlgO protein
MSSQSGHAYDNPGVSFLKILLAATILLLLPLGCVEQKHRPIHIQPPESLRIIDTRASTTKQDPVPLAVPEVVRVLDTASDELASQILPAIPQGKRIAILPLTCPNGGVYRIGDMFSTQLQRRAIQRGLDVLDRDYIDTLLREQTQFSDDASGDVTAIGKLLDASILVVGRTVPMRHGVAVTVKAIEVESARVLAVSETREVTGHGLDDLLWYIRRPTSTDVGMLPALSFLYELITPSPRGELRLTENATVRSHQRFRIRVKPVSDCYLYVILFDSQERLSVLFPNPDIDMSHYIRGSCWYDIPSNLNWFWFDEHPGMETFYLLTSYTPLTNLDDLIKQFAVEPHNSVRIASDIRVQIDVSARGMKPGGGGEFVPRGFTVHNRGVGGIQSLPAARAATEHTSAGIERAEGIVQGLSTAVKKLTLMHE